MKKKKKLRKNVCGRGLKYNSISNILILDPEISCTNPHIAEPIPSAGS